MTALLVVVAVWIAVGVGFAVLVRDVLYGPWEFVKTGLTWPGWLIGMVVWVALTRRKR